MGKKLLSIHIFVLLLLTACSKSAKYPSWYLVPPANDAKYLYGVGEGFDPDEAKQAALNDVASRLRTNVSSKFESAYDSDSTGNSSSIAQKVSSQVEKMSITNYSILKNEKVKGNENYVVMVGVGTQAMINAYNKDITSQKSEITRLSSSGAGLLEKQNNLVKANEIGRDLEAKIRILEIVDPTYNSTPDIQFIATAKDKLSEIRSQIKFKVSCKNAEIVSALSYGFNKLNIGVNEASSSGFATINVDEKWIENKVMGSNFAKLVMNISVIDSNGRIIATKIIEISGSSVSSTEMAKQIALKKIRDSIDEVGIFKYLNIMTGN